MKPSAFNIFRRVMRVALVPGLLSGFVPGAHSSSWEPVGLCGGGAMFAPAISPIDPDLMMLNCDMGAAYLSHDGGRHWDMINCAQLRGDISCRPAFHPADVKMIYASSGGRLCISRDQGQTFTPLGNLKDSLFGAIAVCPFDPSCLLAGTAGNRAWISRDGGTNWVECAGPEGEVIGFHFSRNGQAKMLFTATTKGIWRSDDGGRSWAEKSRGLPWAEIQGFAGGDVDQGHALLYCTIRSKVQGGLFAGGIYRSDDLGETWRPAMGGGLNTETKTADEWAYGSISQYRQVLTTDARPRTVYVFNTSTGFFPPHIDTVYRSDDAGTNWRATYFVDPRFQQCNVGGDFVTASTGQSFKGGDVPFGVAICNSDPNRVMLVQNELHVTRDGGGSWFCGSAVPAPGVMPRRGSAWTCNGLVVTTTWHYYVDPFERNRHYICYTDIGWARSVDGGNDWMWWDPKAWPAWRNTCYELAFDPDIAGKIWGAFSDVHDIPNNNIISEHHRHDLPGGVATSLDFGASWKSADEFAGLPGKPVTSIVVDPRSPANQRTLYAGVFEGGVYKSSDDGKTWAGKSTGLGAPGNLRASRVLLHSDGTLFAMICAKRAGRGLPLMSDGVGLYQSRDHADSWKKIGGSPPFLYPKDFSVDAKNSRRILLGACDTGGGDESGGLYLTEDGGQNWRRIGREGPQTFGGYFHPKHAGWIYMTLTEGAPGAGLWLSKDSGKSWQPFKLLPFCNIQRVEFDPSDDGRIYVTTFGGSVWHGPADPLDEQARRTAGDSTRLF